MTKLTDNIETLKNIGPSRKKEFSLVGVFLVRDLLYFFPKSYQSRGFAKPIEQLEIGEIATILASPIRIQNVFTLNRQITKISVADASGEIDCIFYNQPYIKNALIQKKAYIFSGKVSRYGLEQPEYEKESETHDAVLPIYKFASQKIIRKIIKNMLKTTAVPELVPLFLQKELDLPSAKKAFFDIHFPQNETALAQAQRYIAAEELLLMQTKLRHLRSNIKKSSFLDISCTDIAPIIDTINFCLTNAQKNVVQEIITDMSSGQVMYRMIQGDVGSGKTIVAIIAAYIAVKNGYQAAVMVPTRILASQHFESFCKVLNPLGITTALLSAATTKKEMLTQSAQVIIATHAAISKNTVFFNLGLVVTDEQHRFGVRQRQALAQKGKNPHIIVMSATPIPRSLALILYGDLDISIIDELPKGRSTISTYHVTTAYRERVWAFLEKEAKKNNKSYIVCPAIESDELTDVTEYAQKLKKYYTKKNSTTNVAVLHGKMSDNEKEEIMQGFKKGNTDILIATTVVEVGVDLQNATVMVIEDAHRFGLSQLHQLRGRVGRGSEKSYCILISDTKNAPSLSRIGAMIDHTDGFHLSTMDLQLRGPGEFFGQAQNGSLNLKMANLQRDMDMLKTIQKHAGNIYKDMDKYPELKNMVMQES